MRPGRLDSRTTRSARRTASRTLWVTKRTVRSDSRQIRSSSSCSRSRVMASRAPKGSSISRMRRSWARARARATRWRMPPDSSCGRLVCEAVQPHQAQELGGPGLAGRLADAAQAEGQLDVAGHAEPREQGGILKHQRGVAGRALDPAGRGPVQPGDQVEQGALAAPGGPDQAHELTRCHRQGDAIEGGHRRPRPGHTPWTRRRAPPRAPRGGGTAGGRSGSTTVTARDTCGWPSAASTWFSRVRS